MGEDRGQGVFSGIDGAPEVHVHQFLEHGELGILEEAAHADTGVVDEDIDLSEGFEGGFDEPLAVGLPAHVAGDGVQGGLWVLELELVEFIVIAAAGRYFSALGQEEFHQGLTDTVAAAGDGHHFIREITHRSA